MQTNQQHLNKAINYIVTNMTLSPNLKKVASIAGFSKFHFHRLFKEHTGETLASFTKRIRLEHSAFLLVFYKHRSITDIALSCGFLSSQSFSTAFKKYYNLSPSTYKQKKGCGGIAVRDPQIIAKYEVCIQYIFGFNMVYERSFGINDNKSLAEKRQQIQEQYPNKTYIGIAWDNPHITPQENCRYDYGYIIENNSSKSTLPTQSIEAQTYATLTLLLHNITTIEIWEFLYISWLPRHGYKPHSLFCFEKIVGENISFYLPVMKV
jgi:AraC family transcriptional regulator